MTEDMLTQWRPIDIAELKAYLGFNILMGLVHLPELEDYRSRFRDISRYLHFVDNSSLRPRDDAGHDRHPGILQLMKP